MGLYAIFNAAGALAYTSTGLPAVPGAGFTAIEIGSPLDLGANTYTLAAGALVTTPIPALTASQNAAAKAAIGQYNALIATGFTYGGNLFQIDPASQANIAAVGSMALGSITNPASVPWPADFAWIDAANVNIPMTAPVMYAFAQAVGWYVSFCVLNLRAIKSAILAAATPQAVAAIDVTAGYPAASA